MKMDIELLNRAMRAEARELGLCDEWYGQWSDDADIDELLNKYVRGIDFVIGKGFPEDDILLRYAGKDKLREHGIYLDSDIDEQVGSGVYVIGVGCTVKLKVDGFSVVTVYVRGNAQVDLQISENGKAFVEMYDDARLKIENKGESRSFVYRHGGEVEKKGNVLVRDKTRQP